MESLDTFTAAVTERFQQHTKRSLRIRNKPDDLRQTFSLAVRHKFPKAQYPWLRKHSALAKILLATYSADTLEQMIAYYLTHSECYLSTGISFESFYASAPRISTALATTATKATRVEERKQVSEPVDPKAHQIHDLVNSPFFTKLPAIFQQKVLANADEKETH